MKIVHLGLISLPQFWYVVLVAYIIQSDQHFMCSDKSKIAGKLDALNCSFRQSNKGTLCVLVMTEIKPMPVLSGRLCYMISKRD